MNSATVYNYRKIIIRKAATSNKYNKKIKQGRSAVRKKLNISVIQG